MDSQPIEERAAARCPDPPKVAPPVQDLVGLALSGGGIRSASFNLGILQGLESRNALWLFDYLSTVSGGGFIGAWWSAWLSREKREPGDIFPPPEELEPQRRSDTAVLLSADDGRSPVPSIPDGSLIARRHDPIHFVRLFSNYLTPRTGAFSPDTWRLVAFFLRNLVFTWVALLPLLLVAVITAQSYFLLDGKVAQAFLCPLAPAAADELRSATASRASAAAVEQAAKAPYCTIAGMSEAKSSRSTRLHHLWLPMKLILAACGTFALLWLAHSSARAGLAIIAFGVLAALGILMIAPIFRTGPGSAIEWPVVAVIVVCIGIHLVQSLRNLERGRDGDGAAQATVRATSADHRAWLTQQQAWLLKVGTFAGVLLLIAGFGHDIVWFLFSGDASGWRKLTGRIGAGGTVLATIVSAAYTVIKAAPTARATAPSPPGAIGRLLIAVAPPLVLLVLALLFAFGAHDLLAHMIKGDVDGSGSDNLRRLGSAAVWLAVVEVLFALFEIHEGPATPLPDNVYWWRRFVPYPVLRMLGKLPAGHDTEKIPWFYLFSKPASVRIAVVAVMVIVIGLAEYRGPSLRTVFSTIAGSATGTVAALVLFAALAVTFAPRRARLVPDSARPAGLLVIAATTALLCLMSSGSIGTGLHLDALLAALLWIALLIGSVIAVGWLADPNLLSLHGFYKARLARAYLGASNTARRNEEITDAAPGDDLQLTDIWNHDAGAPYHLINTTLNLVGASDLATSQRSAENFIMSRYHCGSARAGYRCTADYMSGQLSLGTAAAISGAAVSPVMGSKSPSAALSLLLSLFNVRLGFWAPTPSGRRWNEPHARLWPFYLLRETLANTGQIGMYCYLTDGGHFDNTGLYALVERGCRHIVICDCGADPDLGFEDIGVAIRRCRIDFGAEIDLRIDEFVARTRESGTGRTHVVRGTIQYQEDHLRMLKLATSPQARQGVILWVKPSVTALDAADVRQYRRAHGDFPQQSTADQWYDESQFESYRRLGYDSARAAFADGAGDAAALAIGDFANIDAWFRTRGQVPVD